MITFNTDYNDNTDHELTIEQLEAVAGGGGTPWVGPDPGSGGPSQEPIWVCGTPWGL